VYDPAAGAWTDLSAALSGTPPSPRGNHGFTSAGGKLYVHGGWGDSGEGGAGRAGGVGMARAEAGRRDVLPRDRQRCGQAGMGQGGRRDGGRADEGAPCVRAWARGLVRGWCGEEGTRGGLVAAASPVSGRGAGWRGPNGGGLCFCFVEGGSMCAYAWAQMHPGHPFIRLVGCSAWVRVCACLLVRARVCTLPCTYSSAFFFSLADVSSLCHQHATIPRPVTTPFSTAMVSQAMVHPFARPPSLLVVSCPVSRLASASSRRAATGIRPSIHPGQGPLTAIKGRYLRRG
jgi:hypothetical protein